MKDKINNFFNNWNWDLVAAICSLFLAGCYFTKGDVFLGLLWSICSICSIITTIINKDR